MQTYCGLTGCTGNSSENCFFALEASKVLHQLYVSHIAFFFLTLPSLSILPSGFQNKLVTKQNNFAQPSSKLRTVQVKTTAFGIP